MFERLCSCKIKSLSVFSQPNFGERKLKCPLRSTALDKMNPKVINSRMPTDNMAVCDTWHVRYLFLIDWIWEAGQALSGAVITLLYPLSRNEHAGHLGSLL